MNKKIQELHDQLMDAYTQLKDHVRQNDEHLYDRWEAGGFLVDSNIISMYPCLDEVLESMPEEEEEEDDL